MGTSFVSVLFKTLFGSLSIGKLVTIKLSWIGALEVYNIHCISIYHSLYITVGSKKRIGSILEFEAMQVGLARC